MFHQKNTAIFAAMQAAKGTPAPLVAANALGCLEMSFTPTYDTNKQVYTGSVNDRSVDITETDRYASITANVFAPVLGAAGTLPMLPWLQACQVTSVVDTVSTPNTLTLTNDPIVEEFITAAFHRSKAGEDDKRFTLSDASAILGVEVSHNQRMMFDFTLMGQFERSDDVSAIAPDYTTQKTSKAVVAKRDDTVSTWNNISLCVESISAPNFFGISSERYNRACEEGFLQSAIDSEVTVTILEKHVDEGLDPESWLLEEGEFVYTLGTEDGFIVELVMERLKLQNWAPTTVDNFAGQTLTFVNDGNSYIRFR